MLRAEVKRFIGEKGLIQYGDRVVAGVSGGADSVCMLHLLLTLQEELGIEIFVAHLNHLFRKESHFEFEYVRSLAKSWRLPFYGARIDVPAYSDKQKKSAQLAARECRYFFFLKAASYFNAEKVATGHHANDQAETVLINILSGTGLKGLAGIKPMNSYKGTTIIRPLLRSSREDIVDYCLNNKIQSIDDSSNLKTIYLRNKVRLQLIPYLKANFNPNITETLSRLAEIVGEDNNYLAEETDEYLLRYKQPGEKGTFYLDIKPLKKLHLSLQRRIVKAAWLKLAEDNKVPMLTMKQTDSIIGLWEKAGSGKIIVLPAGGMATVVEGCLFLSVHNNREKVKKSFESFILNVPGTTFAKDHSFYFESFIAESEKLKWPLNQKREAYFDLEKLTMPIFVRSRQRKDFFRPLGMKGRKKKLKKFFTDKKIASHNRNAIPLLISGDEIIWVTGHAVAEPFCITEETDKVLVIKFFNNDMNRERSEDGQYRKNPYQQC